MKDNLNPNKINTANNNTNQNSQSENRAEANHHGKSRQPAAKNHPQPKKPVLGRLVDIAEGEPKARPQEQKTQNSQRRRRGQNDGKRQNLPHNPSTKSLKVMFLGGVGEIGKNMTVFEYGDSIVVLDTGMAFPTEHMPGVDVVIPDMTYLYNNRQKIKGIVITHGHEDHIGALPFLVQKLGGKVDVYGTKLTLGLIEGKLFEYSCQKNVNLVAVSDRSIVSLGAFTAEFIHVSHSVAGACAICLRTPLGAVFHTGDFKVDYTPLGNEIMNLNRIAEIGQSGVLLLMSDSTNAEKQGYSMSESVVKNTMNKLFSEAKGRRIIIATFASNIDRIGMFTELARVYKRKIAVTGRSMIANLETAGRVGYIKFDKSLFVDIDNINNIEDGRLLILSTGSQGEPMSALTRMACGEFNKVKIGGNDTIVISATPIPGNEKDVYTVINNLYRLGAIVLYSALADVHVSGHAYQEELKLIYSLIKPKFFIPVHGEFRHLKQHAMLIEKLGHKSANIITPENGDFVELNQHSIKINGKVTFGNVMVDGSGVGDVGNTVLRDRLTLAEDGILVVAVSISNGVLVSGPEILSRGCFYDGMESSQGSLAEIKVLINDELKRSESTLNPAVLKVAIQRAARQYFRTKLGRNPVVLPVVLEN